VLMPDLMMDPSVLSMEGRPTIQIQRAIAAITNPPTMANRSQFDPNLLRTPVANRAMVAANNALDRLIESTVGRPSERADEKHSEKHSEPRPNRRREDFGAPGLDIDHNARQSNASVTALMQRVLTAATAPTPMPLPEALNDRAEALANALRNCNTLPEIAACAKEQVRGFAESVFLNPLIVQRLTELQLNPDIREFIAAFGKNPLLAVSLPIGSAVRSSMDGAAQREFASEQLEFLNMLAQGRHLNPDGAKAIGTLFQRNDSGEQVINVSARESQVLRDALNALENTASAQECNALFGDVYGGIHSIFAGGAMARLESGRF